MEPADTPPMSAVLHGLPPVPPPSVDPLLDAAATCFARYGVRRTSVQDIVINQVTRAIAPLIAKAIHDRNIAARDPVILAEWLVRIAASLILVEPPDGDEAFLAEMLIPALTP